MKTASLAVSLLLVPVLANAADEPNVEASDSLYFLSVKEESAGNGSALDMTIRELKREPDSSIVEIEYISGGNGPSYLLLVKGMCGLMRARQHTSAVSEQISERPIRFRMTFPKDAKINDSPGLPRLVLSEANCTALRQ